MMDGLESIYKILVGGAIAVISYFTRQIVQDTRRNERDLAAFKTHVSEKYAKEETVQHSLARIHDRLDDVGNDIKTLIREVKK